MAELSDARQIQERLREHRRPDATLLAYKDAGHPVFGLPMPLDLTCPCVCLGA